MADDEYVEGDAGSEPADAPGTVPADEASPRELKQGGFDSAAVSDAPVMHKQRTTQRTAQARKAFAEAVIASKKTAAEKPATEVDELDPEAPEPVAAKEDAAKAKAAGTMEPPVKPAKVVIPTPIAAAPAPSLDPEVRQLVARLKADQDALAAERAEFEKQRKAAEPAPIAAPAAASLEDYVDSAPRAYRNWLEAMRGEKFASDDEFKREVQDFVTQLSSDVLGVPLPESVRTAFDAAQSKKMVRTYKTIQARKEAEAAARAEQERAKAHERAEAERVEQEWAKAASILSQQFAAAPDAEGKPQPSAASKAYPWLAAEDEPGKIIVDVIKAAAAKNGTELSWQEASKQANDYLEAQAKRYFDKRKPLLASTPAAAPVATAPKAAAIAPAAPAVAQAAPKQVPDKKWSRDRHLETTKAAFRTMIAGKQE